MATARRHGFVTATEREARCRESGHVNTSTVQPIGACKPSGDERRTGSQPAVLGSWRGARAQGSGEDETYRSEITLRQVESGQGSEERHDRRAGRPDGDHGSAEQSGAVADRFGAARQNIGAATVGCGGDASLRMPGRGFRGAIVAGPTGPKRKRGFGRATGAALLLVGFFGHSAAAHAEGAVINSRPALRRAAAQT